MANAKKCEGCGKKTPRSGRATIGWEEVAVMWELRFEGGARRLEAHTISRLEAPHEGAEGDRPSCLTISGHGGISPAEWLARPGGVAANGGGQRW